MRLPFLLAALCAGPLGVVAQTVLQIVECDDLPSSITTDTTLQFTTQEISCNTNTPVTVLGGAAVEITSAEASTKLNNVKFVVSSSASFLCTVPQLDWTSVETEPSESTETAFGGAMRVNEGGTATFAEDVTFSGCSLPVQDTKGRSGAAITSLGTVVFGKTAIFKDTLDGGAVYSYGSMTFEGDVTFENNKRLSYGRGGGLYVDEGLVKFKGAASFIDNTVNETYGAKGAGMYSGSEFDGEPTVFSGPVLFRGNGGLGQGGALVLFGRLNVFFESHVTFVNNGAEPTLDSSGTLGGGMLVGSWYDRKGWINKVEFQAGVTATGNGANSGGAFYFRDNVNITMSGPVAITDNTALFGGAIWTKAANLTLPADADLSRNAGIFGCPGIYFEVGREPGEVEFTDGATYNTASRELCYLGLETATPIDLVEDFDCESYLGTAPTADGHPYFVINTRETKTWNLGTSITGGLSCPEQLVLYVTGGEELTILSTAASSTTENVRIEVVTYTKLILQVADLTVTGIYHSHRGGAVFVDVGSSMDVMDTITFLGIAVVYDPDDIWRYTGWSSGAAITNLGTVVFEKTAIFKDTIDGGAVYSYGSMTFEGDVIFENNKRVSSGSGGGLKVVEGLVKFKGAASFIDNEVNQRYGTNGAGMYSGSRVDDEPMVFSGPVLFKGNGGLGQGGAFTLYGTQKVIFESHVTFEDNGGEPTLDRRGTLGGGMFVGGPNEVEFQAGVTATGNSATSGGAFYFSDTVNITMSGPVTITDNTAKSGGAIWTKATKLTLPADADLSRNAAIPGCPGIHYEASQESGDIEFADGATYNTASRELCYLGLETATPIDLVEDFDCESYLETAPTADGYPYLVISTRETKTWNLGTSITGGLSCPEQLIIYVTGGEELTIISTAASATMANVRIEVDTFTKLILQVPDFTVTGIYQSRRGGSFFVGAGSSMDLMGLITFVGITVAYDEDSVGPSLGGPAIYSEGDVKFYEKSSFLGNGQFAKSFPGEQPINQPGGAILNTGKMEFMKKATFKDNFNVNSGNGGAVANSGNLAFNVRSVFLNNSVSASNTDDGQPRGGRGGALYNYGSDGAVVFKGLAVFNDNVGALGGGALAARGTTKNDDVAEGDNRITFEHKAKFKGNFCDDDYPSIYDDDNFADWQDINKGGGALLAYGASTVVFSDTTTFKRNEAPNGGAISNTATVSFVSDASLVMEDNASVDTCPDIENNDEGMIHIGSYSFNGFDPDLCDRS